MSQRNSVNGRPIGTDGSDFSYRMVVDSRYKKVTEGKRRLGNLILSQGFIQFGAAVVHFLPTLEGGSLDRLSVSSSIIFFLSLLIGELGRKRSRVNLLKLYLFGSFVAALLSIAFLLSNEKTFEIIKDLTRWEASRSDIYNITPVLAGLLVQIFALGETISLIQNMAPPKKAS
ncbi:protein jagunal homolog 1 [Striga asiatica]|uniref:Protein jagunal homolog 1 n=1 Tax=Striga asiatica TaxID=4170 RepID=A0A5A7NY01_STRAF|nr:protein jagunal homolog 1 [Striga asiatica]